MHFTKHEQTAFNTIAAISMSGSVADIDDIVSEELNSKQARGVISSLVKKGKIFVDEFQNGHEPVQYHYWPIASDPDCGGFWCDYLSESEYEAELITNDMVKEG